MFVQKKRIIIKEKSKKIMTKENSIEKYDRYWFLWEFREMIFFLSFFVF